MERGGYNSRGRGRGGRGRFLTQSERRRISKYNRFMWIDIENHPPYPISLIGAMGICNNLPNTILLSGGFVDGYKTQRKEYDHVLQYNVKTKKYIQHSKMIKPNYGHKMFPIESDIYIIGGKIVNEIHIYKTSQLKWISHKIDDLYDFGDPKWDTFYATKDNFIYIFNTKSHMRWSIDVINGFEIKTSTVFDQLPKIESIVSVFSYNDQWYVIGKQMRHEQVDTGNRVWYFDGDKREWMKTNAMFDTEWYTFNCLLYSHYLIIGSVQNSMGYAEYGAGAIYDIETDIIVRSNVFNVGLPLSGLVLKDNHCKIYCFGGDDTDSCGKFLEDKQTVIKLRDLHKSKMRFVNTYITENCIDENEKNITIPNSINGLIAAYVILSFI